MDPLPLHPRNENPSLCAALRRQARVLAAMLVACQPQPVADIVEASASPQASAEPVPLTDPPLRDAAVPDGGPRPEAIRRDRELTPDSVPLEPTVEVSRDAGPDAAPSLRYPPLFTLPYGMRVIDLAAPPKLPEVAVGAIDALRRRLEPRFTVDLAQGRMRIAVTTGAWPLPAKSELRARHDRYGHLLFWPDDATYRNIPPGSLRALLSELRLDAVPMAVPEVKGPQDGPRRLGVKTRRWELEARAGKVFLDVGSVPGAGQAGPLLCRTFLELSAMPPSSSPCQADDIPLFAQLNWATGGAVTFEASALERRTERKGLDLAVPPAGLRLSVEPLRRSRSQIFPTQNELVAFRTSAVEHSAPGAGADAQAPPVEVGVLIANGSDQAMTLFLDGVPLAWLPPGAEEHFRSLQRGRYILSSRSFLGEVLATHQSIYVPTRVDLGQ